MAFIAINLPFIGEGPNPERFRNTIVLVEGSPTPVGSYSTDQLSVATVEGTTNRVAQADTNRVRIHNIAGSPAGTSCLITFWPGTGYAFTWDLGKGPMAGSDFPIVGPPAQGLKYSVAGSAINNWQLVVSI